MKRWSSQATICKIFSDNDNLWISTLKGLIGYDTSTKEYLQYTQSDGLLSDLFTLNSGLRSSDGRIYLGTPKGFNAFYPRQLVRNEYKPPIEVTEFQLFNKVSNMDDYIVIDKETNPNLLLHIITTHLALNLQHLVTLLLKKISIHLNWKDSTRDGMMQITTEKPLTQIFLPENIYSE